jgi:hypothetical protein
MGEQEALAIAGTIGIGVTTKNEEEKENKLPTSPKLPTLPKRPR